MRKKHKSRSVAEEGKLPWMLVDYVSGDVLSRHPNENGALLSALFHINKGDSVWWHDSKVSLQVAGHYGTVNSSDPASPRRFKTQFYE